MRPSGTSGLAGITVCIAISLASCSERPSYTERACDAVTTFFSRAPSELITEGSFTPEARNLIAEAIRAGSESFEPSIRGAAFATEELFSADAHPQDVIRAMEPLREVCARLGS